VRDAPAAPPSFLFLNTRRTRVDSVVLEPPSVVRRLPIALQLLCALAFGVLAASVASADIGFTDAAAIARQLHPGLPLLGLKHRNQNNDAGGYYHTVCIYPDNSAYETNRLSMFDGAILESGLETFPLQTAITNAAVLERLPLVTCLLYNLRAHET
jgi:hypothetical protein